MKVERTGKPGKTDTVKRVRRVRRAVETSFVESLSNVEKVEGEAASQKTPQQEGLSPQAVAMAVLDPLLALQEIYPDSANNAACLARAEELLASLEHLREALLWDGRISRAVLEELQRGVRNRRMFHADPELTEILDEVELRVAVELAKWERAHDS